MININGAKFAAVKLTDGRTVYCAYNFEGCLVVLDEAGEGTMDYVPTVEAAAELAGVVIPQRRLASY